MRLRAGWLPGPGSLGTSKDVTFLVLKNIFYLLVMCFGVCKSGYGIRMGWFGFVRAKLDMLIY